MALHRKFIDACYKRLEVRPFSVNFTRYKMDRLTVFVLKEKSLRNSSVNSVNKCNQINFVFVFTSYKIQ